MQPSHLKVLKIPITIAIPNHIHSPNSNRTHNATSLSLSGWTFRGQRVVQAVLNDLVKSKGLGSTGANELIIYGGALEMPRERCK